MLYDIQKIKDEAFIEAIAELKKEFKNNISILNKIEVFEKNELQRKEKDSVF